jgi:uncharacterized UPF0160 family protein
MQTIVTHSGSFDPDDVLAAATVSIYLGEGNYEIVRSRDEEVINKADWVLDVGGKYDPELKRFDHHQNGVPKRENGVPYSAFGLVWLEIGEKICASASIAEKIDIKLVQPIDAADNQVEVCCECHIGLESFEFFDVINTFKPAWGSIENHDVGFNRAVSFARKLLRRMIAHGQGDEKMKTLIQSVYDSSEAKEILVFDEPIVRAIVSDFEEVKVFVSPVFGVSVSNWMAVSVPKQNEEFKNRAIFPESWAGLSGEELEKESGIDGAIFCHKELYIFVAKTKEASLQAASKFITC